MANHGFIFFLGWGVPEKVGRFFRFFPGFFRFVSFLVVFVVSIVLLCLWLSALCELVRGIPKFKEVIRAPSLLLEA